MELNLARLDLLSIRLVVLCADLGTLSKAARANLSVAGASHRLSAFEDRLGARLFDRGRRGLHLTAAGVQFIGYARPLIELAIAAFRCVQGDASGARSPSLIQHSIHDSSSFTLETHL